MESKYHIGIRFRGFAKSFLKIENAKTNDNNPHYVPHMTLLRPFYATNEKELINAFNDTLKQYTEPIKFTLTDINYFNNEQKVIKAEIKRNPEIEGIIHNLEGGLENIIRFQHEKIGEEINLHSTISIEDDLTVLPKLDHSILPIDQYMLRIYLLKHTDPKQILKEYDFYLGRSLKREEAISKDLFKDTIAAFTAKTGLKPTPNGFVQT